MERKQRNQDYLSIEAKKTVLKTPKVWMWESSDSDIYIYIYIYIYIFINFCLLKDQVDQAPKTRMTRSYARVWSPHRPFWIVKENYYALCKLFEFVKHLSLYVLLYTFSSLIITTRTTIINNTNILHSTSHSSYPRTEAWKCIPILKLTIWSLKKCSPIYLANI